MSFQKVSMQLWEFARNCYQGISRGRPIVHQMELLDRPIGSLFLGLSHTKHAYTWLHSTTYWWTTKIMVWHYFYFDTGVLDFDLYNAVGQWSMANDNKGKATATKLSTSDWVEVMWYKLNSVFQSSIPVRNPVLQWLDVGNYYYSRLHKSCISGNKPNS